MPQPITKQETRPIESLVPYPRQSDIFDPLSEDELQQLAESIKQSGLQHPIDILPDGTILGGHNRLAAVRLLGWHEVPVNVRHDLAGRSDTDLDRVFIEDNLNRRQMDVLQIARTYQALKVDTSRRGQAERRGDLRDQLGKRFGKSGRMLDRYVRLLGLPRALHTAVSRKQITLAQGESLLKLSKEALSQIATEYANGRPLAALIPSQRVPAGPNALTSSVLRSFQMRVKQIAVTQSQSQSTSLSQSQLSALQDIRDLIDQLLPIPPRT